MNTIGINHNLDRARIKKLLSIGLFASILTGIGDFLLGYAEEIPGGQLCLERHGRRAESGGRTDDRRWTAGLLRHLPGGACL